MEIKTIDIASNIKLFFVPTNKFKTVTVMIKFIDDLQKENVAANLLLSKIFNESCQKYPTYPKLKAYKESLYGLALSFNNEHAMAESAIVAKMRFVSPKYLSSESNILEKAFELVNDIVYHPLVENNLFDSKIFDFVKQNSLQEYKQLEDRKESFSALHVNEYIKGEHPYKYSSKGTYETLDKLTNKNVYDAYSNLLDRPIQLFVAGDLDETVLIELIKKYLKNGSKIVSPKHIITLPENNKEVYEVKANFSQSQLVSVYNLKELISEKDYIIANLFNEIYGGGSSSKLFQIIREKHNYCYSIYSTLRTLSSSMIVSTGIDSKNKEDTLNLCETLLNDIKEGKVTDEEFSFAKESYATGLKSSEDRGSSMIVRIMNSILSEQKYLSIEEQLELLNSITKNDIINFSKSVKLSYSYFLCQGGVK